MSDLYELTLVWPYPAEKAILTGTFDQWTCSIAMERKEFGFSATVRVPWEEKVLYKFIIDGVWTTIDHTLTESDSKGNINNVYHTPTKPKEIVTPSHELPAKLNPATTPVLTPEEPVKGGTTIVKENPSPADPTHVTEPVNTPKADPLPTPPTLKQPNELQIVLVNDTSADSGPPPAVNSSNSTNPPSTHNPPVLPKPSVPPEPPKKEEAVSKPEEVKPHSTADAKPQVPPVKSSTPALPVNPQPPSKDQQKSPSSSQDKTTLDMDSKERKRKKRNIIFSWLRRFSQKMHDLSCICA